MTLSKAYSSAPTSIILRVFGSWESPSTFLVIRQVESHVHTADNVH